MTYIGRQKILQEKDLGDNFVQVTLEATLERVPVLGEPVYETAPGLGKKETVIYNKSVLEKVKTDEENGDESSLRGIRCSDATAAVLLALMNHCVKTDDLEYVFQSVLQTIGRASQNKTRSLTKIHENNNTIYDLKDARMG